MLKTHAIEMQPKCLVFHHLQRWYVLNYARTTYQYNCNVDTYDPWVDINEAVREYNIRPINEPEKGKYDAILLAVAHDEFKELSVEQIKVFGKDNHVLYDIKYLLKANEVDGRL